MILLGTWVIRSMICVVHTHLTHVHNNTQMIPTCASTSPSLSHQWSTPRVVPLVTSSTLYPSPADLSTTWQPLSSKGCPRTTARPDTASLRHEAASPQLPRSSQSDSPIELSALAITCRRCSAVAVPISRPTSTSNNNTCVPRKIAAVMGAAVVRAGLGTTTTTAFSRLILFYFSINSLFFGPRSILVPERTLSLFSAHPTRGFACTFRWWLPPCGASPHTPHGINSSYSFSSFTHPPLSTADAAASACCCVATAALWCWCWFLVLLLPDLRVFSRTLFVGRLDVGTRYIIYHVQYPNKRIQISIKKREKRRRHKFRSF